MEIIKADDESADERLLVTGRVTIDQVCAITFTRKAAGELRLRLREELEKVRAKGAPEEAARASVALQRLEGAAVGTIHGFAATILRERPIEAFLDPSFRAEDEGKRRRGRRGLDHLDVLRRVDGVGKAACGSGLGGNSWGTAQGVSPPT